MNARTFLLLIAGVTVGGCSSTSGITGDCGPTGASGMCINNGYIMLGTATSLNGSWTQQSESGSSQTFGVSFLRDP